VNLVREELVRAKPGGPSAVTIGKFDGVHRGHRHFLERFRDAARGEGLTAVAVILHPSPRAVLRPDLPVSYLTGLEERIDLIRSLGIDVVTVLTFTSEVANLSAEQFVTNLVDTLNMKRLFIGPGFALGRGREGTPEVLSRLGEKLGFFVDVCPPFQVEGEVISSSAVRGALAEGDMETVTRLLGRHYALRGPVVRGAERGRTIGFPTANVSVGADRALPPFGVYATWAYPGEAMRAAATNIGVRPTFDNGAPSVEVFILDFEGDLYGHILRIELVKRLRGEQRFGNVEELVKQMNKDVEDARAVLR
jgi:riboflavin kinase/FMN adenylyltransferase